MAGSTVVHDPGMAEDCGHERSAAHVAHATIPGGWYMIRLRVLAGRIGAVVAGVTPFTDHIGTTVIDKSVEEAARVMAHRAVTTGIAVYRGVRFARRTEHDMVRTAVMTGGTVTGDTGVRKYRWSERIHCMAQFAVLCRWQVAGRLDQLEPVRDKAFVMTALAAAGDARVHRREEGCRCKYSRGIVAHAAVIPRGNMINAFRRCDAGGMTGRTIVGVDACMVVADTRKGGEVCRYMARRTIQAGGHMTQMLARRNVTVMAQRAITGIDTGVVEYRTGKGVGVMAVDAVLVGGIGRDMVEQLAHADHVVVTGRTAANDAGMIITARAESTRGMTDLAIVCADRHVFVKRCGQW